MAKTAVATKNSTAVGAVMDFSSDVEDLRGRLAKPSGDRIKIENKQFKLPSGDVLDFLDVVIVDFVYKNAYYEGAFVKGENSPPNCFSLSTEPLTMVPSANSPEAQCDNCAGCAQNQFGSAGKGKACQNRVLLAVLPTDAGPETPFAILDISPTAVKPFGAYVTAVAKGLGRPPYGVITHIECNNAVKHDVVMFSEPQSIEDADFITMLRSRREEARDRLLVEPDVAAMNAANDSKPKPKSKLLAPKRRAA